MTNHAVNAVLSLHSRLALHLLDAASLLASALLSLRLRPLLCGKVPELT